VKTLRADASVGFVNAKVGHCQALKSKPPPVKAGGGFFIALRSSYLTFGSVAAMVFDAGLQTAWPHPLALTPISSPGARVMSYTILSGRDGSPLTPDGT
jgi:hypothetical protein